MEKKTEKKTNVLLYVVIGLLVVVLIGVGVFFALKNKNISNNPKDNNSTSISNNEPEEKAKKNIKNEVITAENYQNIMDRLETEFEKEDDEVYYLAYATTYYIFKAGLSSALTNNTDESVVYKNIYGKTLQQLIDEGKQLMKDNNVTLEQYKNELKKKQ